MPTRILQRPKQGGGPGTVSTSNGFATLAEVEAALTGSTSSTARSATPVRSELDASDAFRSEISAVLEEGLEAVAASAAPQEAAVVQQPTMMSREARELMLGGNGAQGLEMWKVGRSRGGESGL